MSDFDNQNNDGLEELFQEADQPQMEEESVYAEPTYESEQKESSIFAIISMICGILGVLCCCFGVISIVLSVAGVVLGIISIKKAEPLKGMAIAGIVCGAVGLISSIALLIFSAAITSSQELLEEFLEMFPEDVQQQILESL